MFSRYWRCTVCGLVATYPMRSQKEIEELYHEDIEHFDPYIAQIEVHRKYFQRKLEEIRGMANVKTLLDIGCAMGVLLEEAGKQRIDAYGVDVSEDAVAYCKKKGLKADTSYPKKHFDAITAFEVLEHEPNPLGMLRRIHKLLNNGGIVVLTTPNYSGFWRKIMGKHWVSFRHPEHVTFWSPTALKVLMEKAGFRDSRVMRDSPRPFPLSFLFTRGADYFPWLEWLLRPIGKIFDRAAIINPINPWDDLIVYGTK